MKSILWFAIPAAAFAAAIPAACGDEIGFEEEFALAQDRSATLAKLVPGSNEYYFYSCLAAQQKGDLAESARLIAQWRRLDGIEFPWLDRMIQRQKLLEADPENPDALGKFAREFVRDHGIDLTHARAEAVPADRYPAALDPALLDHDAWVARAISVAHGRLSGFADEGLEMLDPAALDPERRRNYLERISRRPAGEDFWKTVLADLREKDSLGFGSLAIHSRLLLHDLDALAREEPGLLANSVFVAEYARRLLPDDPAWNLDLAARRETLSRFRAFAESLPPSQNSFKACVFYHCLDAGRAAGEFDRELFDAYLRLPRNAMYIRPRWRDSLAANGAWFPADLSESCVPGLQPVMDDEPLVRDLLSRLMLDAPDWQPFAELFPDDYAKALFAETKLLAGLGDAESWHSLLPPGSLAALRDRVDIALGPENPAISRPDAPVSLSVYIKNVSRLTVQVFEIDTFHFFRDNAEVDTAIDLDGMSPTSERVINYDFPPIRRHLEKIDVPEIAGRGLFVVELIGDTGVSSRAVIRRGRLFAATRESAAGIVFTVLDESLERVPDARVWIGGHEFDPGPDGDIVVPYIASDGTSAFASAPRALLRLGDFTDTVPFTPTPEAYNLSANFLIDREQAVSGTRATVSVVPLLSCSGAPIAPSLLSEAGLEVTLLDAAGVSTTRRIPLGELPDTGAATCEISIPEGIREIGLALFGSVRDIALGRDIPLSARRSIPVNTLDSSSAVAAAFLRRTADGAFIEVRGKAGEPLRGRVVQLSFFHRGIIQQVNATLQTDASGRISLGAIPAYVETVSATVDGFHASWDMATKRVGFPGTIAVAAGDPIVLPNPDSQDSASAPATLFRHIGSGFQGTPVSDASAAIAATPSSITIAGLEPGFYSLSMPSADGRLATEIVVFGAPSSSGFSSFGSTVAEPDAPALPLIDSFETAGDTVRIHVANATPSTRIHLLARWAVSDRLPLYGAPQIPPAAGSRWPAASLYVSGRALGDEVRYVLERRFAASRPGNMLQHPSLLLRPVPTRYTHSERLDARQGAEYDRVVAAEAPAPQAMLAARGAGGSRIERGETPIIPSLDFLPAPAIAKPNLEPDAEGFVSVDRESIGFRTELVAVLADDGVTSSFSFALPEAVPMAPRQRALRNPLKADVPLAERRRAVPLLPGEALKIADAASSRIERIDTVDRLFDLLRDFDSTGEAPFARFSFVRKWAALDDAAKRDAYSKHACHELDLFLYFKDRAFFDSVVAPIVRGVHAPDFVDSWLAGADLSQWLDSDRLATLNAAEIALLAMRSDPDTRARLARMLADRAELSPIDPATLDARFRAALGGNAADEPPEAAELRDMAAELRDMAAAPAPEAARGLRMNKAALAAPAAMDAAMSAESSELGAAVAKPAPLARRKAARLESDKLARDAATRAFHRSPETTREWIESRYYRRDLQYTPYTGPVPERIAASSFWSDVAARAPDDPAAPFLSSSIVELALSPVSPEYCFSDAMFALAVTGLPFEAAPEQAPVASPDGSAELRATSPMIVVESIVEAAPTDSAGFPLLVAESFFDPGRTVTGQDGETRPMPAAGEFVAGRPYLARIVLANPSDTRLRGNVLFQVPEGAVPLADCQYTRGAPVDLQPYSTASVEYRFYFPAPGDFAHFPASVSTREGATARAAASPFHVAATAPEGDPDTWEAISQDGSDDRVLEFLRAANPLRLDLGLIAFRMRDRAMFDRVTALLRERGVFVPVLWGYAFMHLDPDAMREYLRLGARLDVGPWFDSPLLRADAAESGELVHAEYWPLVNARAHALGGRRHIQDSTFARTYSQFLEYLSFKPAITGSDRLALAVYLLLQDRVDDASAQMAQIDPGAIGERIQYDYLRAYLAFCSSDAALAARIAAPYRDHPVERWRGLFGEILAQAAEISGGAAADGGQAQGVAASAAAAPFIALEEDAEGSVSIHHSGIAKCVVRYYPMDLELLFSRSPFAGDASERFSIIRPARADEVDLPADGAPARVDVPAEFRSRNVRIEAEGGGATAALVHTPHSLVVRVSEASGMLSASDPGGAPLPAAYVKVYARHADGRVIFYKDGYTDLRGRFDYASLSTGDLATAARFAILVSSPSNGAVIREAAPPNR